MLVVIIIVQSVNVSCDIVKTVNVSCDIVLQHLAELFGHTFVYIYANILE